MAFIDKIYGTVEQYDEFRTWCEKNRPEILVHFYSRENYKTEHSDPERCITNFPEEVDNWLLENCDIKWVTDYIKGQYEIGENHEKIKSK